MNFTFEKRARLRMYFWALLMLAFVFALIDIYLAARTLGYISVKFSDPMFQVLLILGVYPAWKIDPLLIAVVSSIAYTALTFSSTKQWHKELGIFSGDADLIWFLFFQSAAASIIFYVLFSAFLEAYLRFFNWFKNT